MTEVTSTRDFSKKLAALPLSTQRKVGAEFASGVLGLVPEHRRKLLKQVLDVAGNKDSAAEELQMAYRMAHSAYVETQPESEFNELDFKLQAAHFVAQACETCVMPTYGEARTIHLAQTVAMYCRMAATCSHIPHDQEKGLDFSHAAQELEKLINNQHAILKRYSGK
jgi:hypothetical protein